MPLGIPLVRSVGRQTVMYLAGRTRQMNVFQSSRMLISTMMKFIDTARMANAAKPAWMWYALRNSSPRDRPDTAAGAAAVAGAGTRSPERLTGIGATYSIESMEALVLLSGVTTFPTYGR